MTSSGWPDVLLVVVVLAPLAAAVLALAVAAPHGDQRWTTAGGAIAAAGAVVLLVAGQHPHVAPLAPDDLALAAIAGCALLAIGGRVPTHTPVSAAVVTLAACAIASGAPGQPSTVGPVLGAAAAVVLLALTGGAAKLAVAAAGVGVVTAAVGVHSGGQGGAVTVIVGAALVGVAAGASPRRPASVLVPLALVLGSRVGPHLVQTSAARWSALGLAAFGAALATLPALRARWAWPAAGAALVPWVLAAAVGPVPGTQPAVRALAAGTVIALALGGPLALLVVAPGVAVLGYAIADGHGWPRPALAALLGLTLIGLTTDRARAASARLRPVDVVSASAGAWLLLRPTSWTWTRVAGLGAYTDGTALAAVVALTAGLFFTISGGGTTVGSLVPLTVAGDDRIGSPPARPDARIAVAATLMGLVAAALVRSARL